MGRAGPGSSARAFRAERRRRPYGAPAHRLAPRADLAAASLDHHLFTALVALPQGQRRQLAQVSAEPREVATRAKPLYLLRRSTTGSNERTKSYNQCVQKGVRVGRSRPQEPHSARLTAFVQSWQLSRRISARGQGPRASRTKMRRQTLSTVTGSGAANADPAGGHDDPRARGSSPRESRLRAIALRGDRFRPSEGLTAERNAAARGGAPKPPTDRP